MHCKCYFQENSLQIGWLEIVTFHPALQIECIIILANGTVCLVVSHCRSLELGDEAISKYYKIFKRQIDQSDV